LKTCFTNLNLGEKFVSSTEKASEDERTEALKVLFDVLVAQLMKQHAFLREMANFVFKQFCGELDAGSLQNLIAIVSTPNERASEMVGGDADQSDEDSDNSQDVIVENEEMSEDSDDI